MSLIRVLDSFQSAVFLLLGLAAHQEVPMWALCRATLDQRWGNIVVIGLLYRRPCVAISKNWRSVCGTAIVRGHSRMLIEQRGYSKTRLKYPENIARDYCRAYPGQFPSFTSCCIHPASGILLTFWLVYSCVLSVKQGMFIRGIMRSTLGETSFSRTPQVWRVFAASYIYIKSVAKGMQ